MAKHIHHGKNATVVWYGDDVFDAIFRKEAKQRVAAAAKFFQATVRANIGISGWREATNEEAGQIIAKHGNKWRGVIHLEHGWTKKGGKFASKPGPRSPIAARWKHVKYKSGKWAILEVYVPSQPGEYPRRMFGILQKGIYREGPEIIGKDIEARVGTRILHGIIHELTQRPFLRRTLYEQEDTLRRIFQGKHSGAVTGATGTAGGGSP